MNTKNPNKSIKYIPLIIQDIHKGLIKKLWFCFLIAFTVISFISLFTTLTGITNTITNALILSASITCLIFRNKISTLIKCVSIIALSIGIGLYTVYYLQLTGIGYIWIVLTLYLSSTLVSISFSKKLFISILIFTFIIDITKKYFLFVHPSNMINVNHLYLLNAFFIFLTLYILANYNYQIINLLKKINDQKNKLNKFATFDQLTGLYSLQASDKKSKKIISKANKYNSMFAVLFIDLDDFKTINDTYGHDAGDEVLKIIAARIYVLLNDKGFAARIGGDEFFLVLQIKNEIGESVTFAQELISLINKPINYEGLLISISASVGISSFPEHGKDLNSLLKTADHAMYESKNSGKNRYTLAKA